VPIALKIHNRKAVKEKKKKRNRMPDEGRCFVYCCAQTSSCHWEGIGMARGSSQVRKRKVSTYSKGK